MSSYDTGTGVSTAIGKSGHHVLASDGADVVAFDPWHLHGNYTNIDVWKRSTGAVTHVVEGDVYNIEALATDLTPDGRYLLYSVYDNFTDRLTIHRLDLTSNQNTVIHSSNKMNRLPVAQISDDGQTVVFTGSDEALLKRLKCKEQAVFSSAYAWRKGTISLVTPCHGFTSAETAAISGNGRYVVVNTDDPGVGGSDNDILNDLVRFDLVSGSIVKMTDLPTTSRDSGVTIGTPVISQDGAQAVFSYSSNGNVRIALWSQ